jgi:hypothetical protein
MIPTHVGRTRFHARASGGRRARPLGSAGSRAAHLLRKLCVGATRAMVKLVLIVSAGAGRALRPRLHPREEIAASSPERGEPAGERRERSDRSTRRERAAAFLRGRRPSPPPSRRSARAACTSAAFGCRNELHTPPAARWRS